MFSVDILFLSMFNLCFVDYEDMEPANAKGQLYFDVKMRRKVRGFWKLCVKQNYTLHAWIKLEANAKKSS